MKLNLWQRLWNMIPANAKSSILGSLWIGGNTDNGGKVIRDINLRNAHDSRNVEAWLDFAVTLIGEQISCLPMEAGVWETDQNGKLVFEPDMDSDLAELLKTPNSLMSRRDIVEWISQSLELSGEAYVEKVRVGKQITELWPLISFNITPMIEKSTGLPRAYEYRVGGVSREIDADDIIAIRSVNTANPLAGKSFFNSLQHTVLANYYLRQFQKTFLKNDATPAGILKTDQARVPREIREEIKQEWKTTHGGPNNAGKIAFLTAGTEYQSIQQEFGKLGLSESYTLNRDEILGIYRIPPIMAGVFQFANYANAREQLKMFWTFQKPRILRIDEGLTRHLGSEFGLAIRTDMSGISELRPDMQIMATTAVSVANAGLVTLNEARTRYLDLPPVDDPIADELIEPAPPEPVVDNNVDNSERDNQENTGKSRIIVGQTIIESRLGRMDIPPAMTFGDMEKARRRKRMISKRSHTEFLDKVTTKMWRAYRRYFREQKHRILETLRDIDNSGAGRTQLALWRMELSETKQGELPNIGVLFDASAEEQLILELSRELGVDAAAASGQRALAVVGLDQAFNMDSPRVATVLEKMENRSRRILNTTFEQIRFLLKRSVENQWTIDQLAYEIRQLYSGWTGRVQVGEAAIPRSLRIARTESVAMVNGATQLGFEQSGVVKSKEWLTIQDSVTRIEHSLADGEIVPLNGTFQRTGEALKYPGDPSGSAWNVINCRCAEAPVVEGDESTSLSIVHDYALNGNGLRI